MVLGNYAFPYVGLSGGRTAIILWTNRRPTKAGSYPYDAKGLLTASLRDYNPLLFIEYNHGEPITVALVSITLDPARDTPAVLKAYRAKHGARGGWLWLTGAPPEVTGVLKDFGAYVADPSQHPSMILVGDGRTGQWTRFFGFPSADQLMAKVEELRLARAASATGAGGNG